MKRFISVLLFAVILLSSCGTDTPSVTGDTTTEAAQTVTEAATETEAGTTAGEATAPEDDLSAESPSVADGFVFASAYKEPEVKTSGTKKIKVGGINLSIDYESTFYGSESFVKRDTHVFGFLYKMSRVTTVFPVMSGYYFADFNGDRADDYVTFENGVLSVYASSKNKSRP